ATPERVIGNNFKVAGEILVSYLGYEDVVVIPSGIKAILKDAFKGKNLSILVIPQSVMLIEEDAFAECYALSEVIFEPDSKLVKLGEYAFYKCTELKAINLPKSVEKGNAFVGCDKLLLC
ncbi:MAG: leucine-rich repeat domain-containing protein, partial [Clostridia bacterium]|nr:leucine-rich repeat domain-containing protein [Clostridia bacterium]